MKRRRLLPTLDALVGDYCCSHRCRWGRHGRNDKPLRWQVDYLTVRAQVIAAMPIPDGHVIECEMVDERTGANVVRRPMTVAPEMQKGSRT